MWGHYKIKGLAKITLGLLFLGLHWGYILRHYLWRAVDHEGEVLESYVTKKRDKKAALKFMKKAMRRY